MCVPLSQRNLTQLFPACALGSDPSWIVTNDLIPVLLSTDRRVTRFVHDYYETVSGVAVKIKVPD